MRRIEIVKKGRTAFVCLLCTLLLTGCIQGVFHAEVHWDGSVDTHLTVGFDQQAQRLLGDWNPLNELRTKVEEQGFTTRAYNDMSYVGFTGTKHFSSVTDLRTFFESIVGKSKQSTQQTTRQPTVTRDEQTSLEYSVEPSYFYTTHTITGNVNVSALIEQMTGNNLKELGQFEQNVSRYVVEQGDLRFKLSLPIQWPVDHNATSVEDDGKTLVWELTSPDDNPLQLRAAVPNVTTLAMAAGGILLLLIVLISMRRRRRRV